MKLTVIGGGGFRIPQLFTALGGDAAPITVTELHLHDVHADRLETIRKILEHLAPGLPKAPKLSFSTDLDEAVTGAQFIFSAMRIGGIDGRIADERTALDLGVLGQETVGPGGLAYAMRTLPVVTHLAERVRELAPDAWLINFTNPAGLVTETMRRILGDRVIGICDTPIGLMRRATRAVGGDPRAVEFDYVGINHLGWLRSLSVDGVDRLPEVLASDTALAGIEEARLLGFDWVRTIGALPNEYLYYYYFTREATARIRSSKETRGEFLKRQQGQFYAESQGLGPAATLELWEETLREREFTYMAESRSDDARDSRLEEDVEDGGYQKVALELMTALSGGETATMILNVGNRGNVPQLPDEAVIEVPCRVDADGVHPQRVAPVAGDMLGLMRQVKAAEQLTLEASLTRSTEVAWRAFAAHPLVDSVAVARQLLDNYRDRIPGVAAAFD